MPNRRHLILCAALAAALPPASANPPRAPDQPYTVEVWSDATFGPDGRIQQLEVVKTPELPAAFVERVRSQLAQARIPPVKDSAGTPAVFQTGVLMSYLVTPNDKGGTVRLQGMRVEPRPVKRYAASQPEGLPPNTPLSARVQCEVGTDGRCGELKMLESTGTYDALRRWALASARGWEFLPQRINGQPVPATVEIALELTIQDLKPADFRDPLKL
jgi:TonB family protein